MANGLALAQAFSNIGKGIFGGQKAYDQGYNATAKAEAERAMMEARTRAAEAQTGLSSAKADEIKRRAGFQTPEYSSQLAATLSGLTLPQAAEVEDFNRTNSWGNDVEDLPWDQAGPPRITPKSAPGFATPDVLQRYGQAKGAHMAALGATGDTNSEQLLKGLELLSKRGDLNSVISNPALASAVGQGYAAVEGKPLFHQGANGTMQLFTGQEALNDVGRSAAMENRAQAGNAAASAALHQAQIPEVQSRIDLNKSKMKTPQTTTLPDGTVIAEGQNIPWKYDSGSDEFVAPPTAQYPNGIRSGNQAKLNAAKSMDYVISQFSAGIDGKPTEQGKGLIDTTPQGGIMGISGYVGKVTDSQKGKRFDNLKEQLSTELRTLFRIPGEGSLSDKEQAQYGIQLPDVTKDAATNRGILNDIQARVRLRLEQSNPLTKSAQPKTAKDFGYASERDALADAQRAVKNGAPRSAVIQRLQEMGITQGAF